MLPEAVHATVSSMLSLRLVLIPVALLVQGQWAQGDVQCRDENNNPVDWYVLYKFPELPKSSTFFKTGKRYMFITSNTVNEGWKIPSENIDHDSSLLAKTLTFLKDPQKEVLWLVYNDQANEILFWEDMIFGHTKGIIAGDNSSGIWLIHSIPHFNGTYPRTGYTYAQSALCITLSTDTLNSVGDLLALNNPHYVNWKIADTLKSRYSDIIEAFTKKHKILSKNITKELTTLQGAKLKAFAKTTDFGYDLYEWVASSLHSDMFVESWMHYPHPLPSSCNMKYRVMNIQSMVIPMPMLNVMFTSNKDHSKLAISHSKPWVCVGDINRAEPQKRRGGGTVCLENEKLHEAYLALINSVENCTSFYYNLAESS